MAKSHADPRLRLALAVIALCAAPGALRAEPEGGVYVFDGEPSCVANGRFTAAQCAAAAAGARAEFEEKAPHFPSREACESLFQQAGCNIGFSSADDGTGTKAALYFTPRRTGFRIFVASPRDLRVLPQAVGEGARFRARPILGAARVAPRLAHPPRASWPPPPAAVPPTAFGVAAPPRGGALPPPPRFDPNFDCAAVLEPSARDSADTACYPAPLRRR